MLINVQESPKHNTQPVEHKRRRTTYTVLPMLEARELKTAVNLCLQPRMILISHICSSKSARCVCQNNGFEAVFTVVISVV